MGLSQGAPEKRPELSKVEARQGATGHNVRYVLWFGIAAAMVALAAVYLLRTAAGNVFYEEEPGRRFVCEAACEE